MAAFASVHSRTLRRRADGVLKRAGRRGLKIVTAESCTAGQLASLLAARSANGSFKGGFVVYSKAAKVAMLGLRPGLLRRETAVSAAVATAMARGAQRRGRADIAIALTGVAGPTRDEDGNPVGLVFIATAGPARRIECWGRRLRIGTANAILLKIHEQALRMLSRAIRAQSRPN